MLDEFNKTRQFRLINLGLWKFLDSTCFFEIDYSDVADIGNADIEDENANVNIVNTTNNDVLGFENTSELSDMKSIDKDEDSPPEELDM